MRVIAQTRVRKEQSAEGDDLVGYVSGVAHKFKAAYPALDEASIEVVMAMVVSYAALRDAGTEVMSSLGLGRASGQIAILRAIWLSPNRSLSLKQIGEQVKVTVSSLSIAVKGLEKSGLVIRSTDVNDRRSTLVTLTPKGKDASAKLVPAIGKLHTQICSVLSDREKKTLTSLLKRVWQSASETR